MTGLIFIISFIVALSVAYIVLTVIKNKLKNNLLNECRRILDIESVNSSVFYNDIYKAYKTADIKKMCNAIDNYKSWLKS